MGGQIEASPQAPSLGIRCSIDHTAHPRLHKGSGTHRAWFQRDDQGAVVESPVALNPGGLSERNQFGVTKRIPPRLASVAAMADAATFGIQNHGCHRHFPGLTDPLRPLKQHCHPALHGGFPHQRTSNDL